jgi:NTP pyrophosphatase (non-canonical NTP hydrolase)
VTTLADNPTLADFQSFVANLCLERGFDKETVPEVFTVLIEEFGELAKAIRRANGQKVDEKSLKFEVAEEVADVFWLLLDLCNRLNVNLEEAFRAKEAKNQKREWK